MPKNVTLALYHILHKEVNGSASIMHKRIMGKKKRMEIVIEVFEPIK